MNNWAIVAIPKKDDNVWKLSSETVPHLTLLSLGEHEPGPESARILSYLEHAITTMQLSPFGMEVKSRGELGPDKADVLFFRKNWSRRIAEFRDVLKKDDTILSWYNASKQFPEWTPHLTVGWPAAPAHDDAIENPLWYIEFDKIALWTGSYDGPEIQLEVNEDALFLEMSELDQDLAEIEKTLSHVVGEPAPSPSIAESLGIDLSRKISDSELFHAQPIAPFKGPTLQNVIDGMTDEERDLMDLIVGCAIEDLVLPDDQGYQDLYESMSDDEKNLIDFVVGTSTDDNFELEHADGLYIDSMRLDVTVAGEDAVQYGTKGMKWGVRNDKYSGSRMSRTLNTSDNAKAIRSDAKAKVKAGTATLGEAHAAAVKSTGRRVTNSLLGDRQYWKRGLQIAGVSAVGVGASFAVPALLPASALAAVSGGVGGASVCFATCGLLIGGHATTAAALGSQMITTIGLTSTYIGANVSSSVAGLTNLGRAVLGNRRVDKSYASLTNNMAGTQRSGNAKTRKVLNQSGALAKKRVSPLKQFDEIPGISLDQKVQDIDALHALDTVIAEVTADNGDLLQFGVRGMKWGILRRRGSDGRVVSSGSAQKTAEDAADAQDLIKRISSAGGVHALSNAEIQRLTTRINVETQYKKALDAQPKLFDKTHDKFRRGLEFGKTANDALKFANSDAGVFIRLLFNGGKPVASSKTGAVSEALKVVVPAIKLDSSGNRIKAPKPAKKQKDDN